MKTARTQISQVVANSIYDGVKSKKISKQVAAYLLSERRVNELNSVIRDVQEDWAKKGYIEVIASSAHKFNDNVRDNITKQIKKLYPYAKNIKVTEVNDPDVIGGVVLNLANQQLDLSVLAKLNKFRYLTTNKGTK